MLFQEADVSISALFITEERLQYFDMTKPYMDLGLDTLIAKEGVEGAPFNFLRPFDTPLWLAILGCNIACGLLVSSCSYFSPFGYKGRYIQRRNKDNQKHRNMRHELNFNNSLWHAFVSLLTQVNDRVSKMSLLDLSVFLLLWPMRGHAYMYMYIRRMVIRRMVNLLSPFWH